MSSLAKRLLFPNDPSLPLLLVSQVPDELNSELYDFIALALRAFVNPWWSKITRYDKQFLPEITRILTHVFRALEHRILTADLPPIIFCDVPTIVTVHYRDYRNAASKVSTSYASGGAMSLPQLFHQLQPHMAVSPDGVINPEYVRQILDVVLKACLPTEDYSPETERLIVREIILKIILNDVIPKVTQPWFIQKMILDQLGNQPVIKTSGPRTPPPVRSSSSQSFSFQTIIVFFLSAVQAISGACLAFINAYKQAMSTIKLVNQSSPSPRPSRAPTPQSHAGDLSSKRSTPSIRDPLSHSPTPSISSSTSSLPKSPVSPVAFPPHTVPVLPEAIPQDYAQPALLMVAEVFSTNERYASSTILGTVAMTASTFTPFVDRLLPYLLHNTLSSAFLFNIVRNAKRTLFPNGYPAPPPVDPTPEEQAEIRAKLLAWRPSGGAAHLLPLLLGPDPSETLAGALDPLSNKACNVHLILVILDRILITLFPELEASTEP